MQELIIFKALFILVTGASATKLTICAGRTVRFSGDWYASYVLGVLLGIMSINEFAHLISLVRG